MSTGASANDYKVELPAGGFLHLQTPDEVLFWNESLARYKEDYSLLKQNDLIALGQLLQMQVMLFRSQTEINGMEPELDAGGVPTGAYMRVERTAAEIVALQKTMLATGGEMRALEKSLGIDKATREQGGAHTLDGYLKDLKRAAHARGVHISKRVIAYERVINELRVRLRILYHGDKEDRDYEDITPKTILDWLKGECDRLTEVDAKFNKEVGKLWVGKL